MQDLGYYNGRYAPISEMTVPMNDRSSWFGDGVYDATYSRNHKIYMLDAHLDRFFSGAEQLEIKIPYTKAELGELLSELVRKVDCPNQFVYWQITRGDEGKNRNHDYSYPLVPGNLWVTLTPREVQNTYAPIKVITLEDTRFLHCNIKTLNLIPSVMASHKAVVAGASESILHRGDRVTECAHSNVSIIKDGTFRTAPTDNLILPGIARANLIRFCHDLGIPVDESPFTLDDLMDADEIIVSSSGSFCLAVDEIDGKQVGGKAPALLRSIQDAAVRDFETATNA